MHFLCVKLKSIKFVCLMALVAILLAVSINGVASAQVFFGYSTKRVPIYSVETVNKQVAISFDAAWGADKTAKIVETLQAYNVGATFFLVGFWVDKNSDMVKLIDEAGFEIGNHSSTHPDLTTVSSEKLEAELDGCNTLIKNITGKDVKLFRAPYGAYNNNVLDTATKLGMQTIQWDVDSLDWKGLSADQITMRILNNVKNGSIILCHNNSDHILDALPMVLDRLQKQGYKVTSIGDLIYKDNYNIDRNGIQKQKV